VLIELVTQLLYLGLRIIHNSLLFGR